MKKAILLFSLLTLIFSYPFCQTPGPESDIPEWSKMMYSGEYEVGDVLEAHDDYYKKKERKKDQHTQNLKRWLRLQTRDIWGLEGGKNTFREARKKQEAYLEKIERSKESSRAPTSNWIGIGPWDWDHDAVGRSYAPGAAHVYCIEQSLFNPNMLVCGTATAGVWKSLDKGLSWNLITRDLPVNSVITLEIDHTNDDIIYFVSGGSVYKTTDGGLVWAIIGDATFTSLNHSCKDIVMDPLVNTTLFLCSDEGLYRTTDGGANWTQLMTGTFQELEYHPTNPLILYSVRQIGDVTEFYKSIDGGLSWVLKPSGWPAPVTPNEQKRTEIATTPADPTRVYALATGSENGGSGLYGIYASNDEGETWVFQCCGPSPSGVPSVSNLNLMGWDDAGLDDGGQYYYDVGLDVSDTDPDEIHVGGVNHWISTDAGVTFSCPAKWSQPAKPEYVHADIHDVRFYGTDLWIACDGGIFYSDDGGANFQKRMTGIEGTDFWGFGTGFNDGEVMLGGTYHNGTLIKDNNVYINDWLCGQGGDNYRGFVNFGIGRRIYHDGGGKLLPGDRTLDFTGFPFAKKPNATYTVGRSSEIVFDPRCYNHAYSGEGTGLWKSEDNGVNFNLVYDFGEDVVAIEISWSQPEVMYVSTDPGYWSTKRLWRTIDAGASWTEITPTSAEINGSTFVPYDIAVSSTNSMELWIARTSMSGNSPTSTIGYQVFHSIDGGATWANISTPMLNDEFLTNICHHRGSDGGVYIGTRKTVYYKNNSMPDWALFGNNLPVTTTSTRLVPYYWGQKLRNGTNRSVYEVDFYGTAPPVAQISADRMESFCPRDTIYYVDHSALSDNGASWSWSFPGGIPATSSDRNPKVVYSAPGTYDVSLTVTDAYGSDNQLLNGFMTITEECQADTIPGNSISLTSSGDYAIVPPLGITTNEITFSAWIKPSGVQPDYSGIVFNSVTSAGMNFRPGMALAYHWPGGTWWWNSGLVIPQEEWSHVAMVLYPDSVRLYLNGVGVTHEATHTSVDFDVDTYLGSYKDWASRNMTGEIDEVCIWNRTLSQEEIRELRHLTKEPQTDPTLLAYYQFNRPSGLVTDRASIFHANLAGSATRTPSSGPFGGGESHRLSVFGSGAQSFPGTDVNLDFPLAGPYPDGEMVLSRINLNPDTPPSGGTLSRSYWILNNYGANPGFNSVIDALFQKTGPISPAEALSPTDFKLYQRSDNAHGPTWSGFIDTGDLATSGADGDIQFNSGLPLTQSGQFVISKEIILPFESLMLNLTLNPSNHVQLEWKSITNADVNRFEIERLDQNQSFQLLIEKPIEEFISGTTYSYTDHKAKKGENIYRIKQVCKDGNISYSNLESILIEGKGDIKIYPNPVEAGQLVQIQFPDDEDYNLEVFSVRGKTIFNAHGKELIQVNCDDWASGSYLFRIQSQNHIHNAVVTVK